MSDETKGNWFQRHKVATALLGLLLLVILISAVSGGSDPKPAENTTSNQPAKPAEPAQPKWDAAAAYEKIQTGMTKAQVEAATEKTSANCGESAIEGYGTTESCNYSGGFGERGAIMVVYSNGAVQSKSKLQF